MQNTDAFERDWREWGLGRPLHREMTFTQAGLALGRGTILAEFGKEGLSAGGLALDGGNEARLLSLLTAAYREPLAGGVIEKIRRAGEVWRAGDKALAQIHLAFLGLPKIDKADAYRLFLAGTALEKGASPSDLLRALGFPRAARDIEKYNPDQPRVPAGSGRESGQWTSGDGGGEQRQKFVRRVQLNVVGATMSDANPQGIVPGAQYAQASSPPILTQQRIKHIRDLHGSGTPDNTKGKFTPEYSTAEAIRGLVEDAWKHATPEDLGAGRTSDRVVIGAGVSIIVDGVAEPYIIGRSAEERRAPSVPTNTYVVVIDSNNYVITCYPINPGMKSILAMSESMQVHLKNLATFDSARVKYFDLHEELGFASIVKMDETVELDLNGAVIRSWPKAAQPEIWWLKWFDADHVVLNLHGPEVAIVSAESWERHHLGYLSGLYLSPKFMLVTYGEEQFHGSRSGELEGNVISVFLRNGAFDFGVQEVMDKDRDSWEFSEVEAGYIFEDKFGFIAYSSELFWVLDVSQKSWRKFPAPVSLWSTHVLSGDAEKAYGVFDNRWDHNRPRPPFELAVFDLVAETAWMQDFAPVENALIAAGFSMSEIKFQPSSTGKIIVSDGKKAALLDFSNSA